MIDMDYYINYIQHYDPESNHTTAWITQNYDSIDSSTPRQSPIQLPAQIPDFNKDNIYVIFKMEDFNQGTQEKYPAPAIWLNDFDANSIYTPFYLYENNFPTPADWISEIDLNGFYAPFYLEGNDFPTPVGWLSEIDLNGIYTPFYLYENNFPTPADWELSVDYEGVYSVFTIVENEFPTPSPWENNVDYEGIYSIFETDQNTFPYPKTAEWVEPFNYLHLIAPFEEEIPATNNFLTLLEQFQNVEQLAWWTGNGNIRISGTYDPDGSGNIININVTKSVKIRLPNLVALGKRPLYPGSQDEVRTYKFLAAKNSQNEIVFLNYNKE